MADIDTEIRAILRRYTVRGHYKATTAEKKTRYALFADGKQHGEPDDHAAIQHRRETLIVGEIVDLVDRHA